MSSSKKTKQIYITTFNHPIESVIKLLFSDETIEALRSNQGFDIKKFIGSDWTIIGSGYLWSGPNNIKVVFIITDKQEIPDFTLVYRLSISHINDIKPNQLNLILSLIRNTFDNTTIIEFRIDYENDSDAAYVEEVFKDLGLNKILENICNNLNYYLKRNNCENVSISNTIIVNHSFLINKNYEEAFNFFYNWKNIAKSIKTDKVWKIIEIENEGNKKDFSITINENIVINYSVVNINKKKDENIEIIYKKTGNSYPALNDYIKFSFYNIDNNICFFLYETHLPYNISSLIYTTVSDYVYYCNKKSKYYIENVLK